MFKRKYLRNFTLICISLCWIGAAYASGNNIPISELPEVVVKAAENAVQDITLKEAERKESNGSVVYEVEGYVDKKEFELKIDGEGNVLKVKEDH